MVPVMFLPSQEISTSTQPGQMLLRVTSRSHPQGPIPAGQARSTEATTRVTPTGQTTAPDQTSPPASPSRQDLRHGTGQDNHATATGQAHPRHQAGETCVTGPAKTTTRPRQDKPTSVTKTRQDLRHDDRTRPTAPPRPNRTTASRRPHRTTCVPKTARHHRVAATGRHRRVATTTQAHPRHQPATPGRPPPQARRQSTAPPAPETNNRPSHPAPPAPHR